MGEVTEKTLIPKELADLIAGECYKEYEKGTPTKELIKIGTKRAVALWKAKKK